MSSSRSNFVLGRSVTSQDGTIPQNRLPSEENVLRAYLFFNEQSIGDFPPGQHKAVNWSSAKCTVGLIKQVYAKAHIPTISDDGMCKQVLRLRDEYKKLNKTPKERRSKGNVQNSIKAFQSRLHNTTLACWDPKAKLLEEDEASLDNMKTQRTFTIGGLDMKRKKMIQRQIEKARRQEEFRKKEEQESAKLHETVDHDVLEKELGPDNDEIMEEKDDSVAADSQVVEAERKATPDIRKSTKRKLEQD